MTKLSHEYVIFPNQWQERRNTDIEIKATGMGRGQNKSGIEKGQNKVDRNHEFVSGKIAKIHIQLDTKLILKSHGHSKIAIEMSIVQTDNGNSEHADLMSQGSALELLVGKWN